MGKSGRETPLALADEVGHYWERTVGDHPWIAWTMICGSVRRRCEIVSDVDIAVETDDALELTAFNIDGIRFTPKSGLRDDGIVRVEYFWSPPGCRGATALFLTGPGGLNVYMRRLAQQKSLKLSQYGLITHDGERLDQSGGEVEEQEASIFAALDMPYLSPVERSHWRSALH